MNRQVRRRLKGKSKEDLEQANNIANLLRSIIAEVETFVNQIVKDNFDDEIIDNTFVKIGISPNGTMAEIEIFNRLTNTIVVYSMTLMELLRHCSAKTLEVLMNEEIPKMIIKSKEYKKSDSTNRVHINNLFS